MSNSSGSNDSSEPTDAWSNRHLWQITPLQDVFWFALAISLMWLGYVLRGVFIPMLIAFAGAYTVEPWLSKLEDRWRFRRSIVISCGLVAVAVAVVIAVALLGPQVATQIEELIEKTPAYIETLATKLEGRINPNWLKKLPLQSGELPVDAAAIGSGAVKHVDGAIGVAGDFLSSATYFLTSLVLIPVYFAFFAWNYGPLLDRAKNIIPDAHRDRILHIAERMDLAIGSFIRGRLIVCAWMMVLFSLGFWIAGVPYWFLLGSITGILSFVPFTAVIGCILAVLVQWIDASAAGSDTTLLQAAMWPVAVYCVVQILEGWVLTPWVQSQSMSMSPVTVFVVLMIGGSLAGLYGLLLAIPITGCLRVICEEFLAPKLENWAADAGRS